MKKNILGILGLFIFIFGFTAVSNENFLSAYNLQNLVKWSSLYAIMGIGVAFVIITGGIDLSAFSSDDCHNRQDYSTCEHLHGCSKPW